MGFDTPGFVPLFPCGTYLKSFQWVSTQWSSYVSGPLISTPHVCACLPIWDGKPRGSRPASRPPPARAAELRHCPVQDTRVVDGQIIFPCGLQAGTISVHWSTNWKKQRSAEAGFLDLCSFSGGLVSRHARGEFPFFDTHPCLLGSGVRREVFARPSLRPPASSMTLSGATVRRRASSSPSERFQNPGFSCLYPFCWTGFRLLTRVYRTKQAGWSFEAHFEG